MNGLLGKLRTDAGKKTLGELIQEREAAAAEIERLASELTELRSRPRAPANVPPPVHEEAAVVLNASFMYRISDVCKLVGLSRSSIYRLVDIGTFPKPVRVSERSIRWRGADIAAWVIARGER